MRNPIRRRHDTEPRCFECGRRKPKHGLVFNGLSSHAFQKPIVASPGGSPNGAPLAQVEAAR